ncbi:autophagy-related protein 9 [Kipferlia bialata]|uniref:Autophagy-related protein 9 n=1 Tax=Kipferlia bialata TaxID=797122 RepID=A0A9K3CSQ4_9EUKA|nr:autophagy-related protein 9 [Kipferlia bialata]|eukprot:g1896.t1
MSHPNTPKRKGRHPLEWEVFLGLCVDWDGVQGCLGSDSYVCEFSVGWPGWGWLSVWMFPTVACVGYLTYLTLSLLVARRDAALIRPFFTNAGLLSHDLPSMSWGEVVDRILVYLPAVEGRELSAADVQKRLLRYDDYLVAGVKAGLIGVDKMYFPRALLFAVQRIVLYPCFVMSEADESGGQRIELHPLLQSNPDEFAKALCNRARSYGIWALCLSPFLLCYSLVETVFSQAYALYTNTELLSSAQWSNCALYRFRAVGEDKTAFERRIRASYVFAEAYMHQFRYPVKEALLRAISKPLSFLALACLLFPLFLGQGAGDRVIFFGFSMTFLLGLAAASSLAVRAMIPSTAKRYEPARAYSRLQRVLLYTDEKWAAAPASKETRQSIAKLYQPWWRRALKDMVAMFKVPILLLRADNPDSWLVKYVRYIASNTEVEGNGATLRCEESIKPGKEQTEVEGATEYAGLDAVDQAVLTDSEECDPAYTI